MFLLTRVWLFLCIIVCVSSVGNEEEEEFEGIEEAIPFVSSLSSVQQVVGPLNRLPPTVEFTGVNPFDIVDNEQPMSRSFQQVADITIHQLRVNHFHTLRVDWCFEGDVGRANRLYCLTREQLHQFSVNSLTHGVPFNFMRQLVGIAGDGTLLGFIKSLDNLSVMRMAELLANPPPNILELIAPALALSIPIHLAILAGAFGEQFHGTGTSVVQNTQTNSSKIKCKRQVGFAPQLKQYCGWRIFALGRARRIINLAFETYSREERLGTFRLLKTGYS